MLDQPKVDGMDVVDRVDEDSSNHITYFASRRVSRAR